MDFGPPPEGRVWVGALFQFMPSLAVGRIPGSAPGNDAYPTVVGNASLRYVGGRGQAGQVRSRWDERVRPVTSLVVTGAFVNAIPDCVVTVSPISAIVCPENTCGVESSG